MQREKCRWRADQPFTSAHPAELKRTPLGTYTYLVAVEQHVVAQAGLDLEGVVAHHARDLVL